MGNPYWILKLHQQMPMEIPFSLAELLASQVVSVFASGGQDRGS
jgi:hypothetical protein